MLDMKQRYHCRQHSSDVRTLEETCCTSRKQIHWYRRSECCYHRRGLGIEPETYGAVIYQCASNAGRPGKVPESFAFFGAKLGTKQGTKCGTRSSSSIEWVHIALPVINDPTCSALATLVSDSAEYYRWIAFTACFISANHGLFSCIRAEKTTISPILMSLCFSKILWSFHSSG